MTPNQNKAQTLVERLEADHGAERACLIVEQCMSMACNKYTPRSGADVLFGLFATELEKFVQQTQ